jgi:hypothetical protein
MDYIFTNRITYKNIINIIAFLMILIIFEFSLLNSSVLGFTLTPFYWRGAQWTPDVEYKLFDEQNPPVFSLKDFEHKFYRYCNQPDKRDHLPVIVMGTFIGETEEKSGKLDLSVSIEGVPISERHRVFSSYYPVNQIDDGSEITEDTLGKLSAVMSKVKEQNKKQADGLATITITINGVAQTKTVKFKTDIPGYEQLYLFKKDPHGFGYWEPAPTELVGDGPLFVIIHGWQSTIYPNFLWMDEMALAISNSQGPKANIYAWFWQNESYYPGLPLCGGNVRPQAQLLTATLTNRHLNPASRVHFIGHSFGGFMGALTADYLLNLKPNANNVYDGINFKVTMLDTDLFVPFNITNKDDAIPHLAQNGVEIENIYCFVGTTIDIRLPPNYNPITNLNIGNCDHGAPIYYYIDGSLWNNPWLPRKKFKFLQPGNTISSIYPLLDIF